MIHMENCFEMKSTLRSYSSIAEVDARLTLAINSYW